MIPGDALAQPVPPAKAVPAEQRIGANGLIGSANPRPATPGRLRGFCSKWAKTTPGEASSLAVATEVLDGKRPDIVNINAGNQTPPGRRGRFFDRLPVLSFHSDGQPTATEVLQSVPLPWDDGLCRLQGVQGAAPNVASLKDGSATRIRGNLHLDKAGTYTLFVVSDDGFSIAVGGVNVLSFDSVRLSNIDTARFSVVEPGVYPIDVLYYDNQGLGEFETFLASSEVCFTQPSHPHRLTDCVDASSTNDLSQELPGDVDTSPASGFSVRFQLLDFTRVDLPTWVTASTDPAFTAVDESCAAEMPLASCGPPAAAACGNGFREMVNLGTLGSPGPFDEEGCDDGNAVAGDGCDGCQVEAGYSCGAGPVGNCLKTSPVSDASVGDAGVADSGTPQQPVFDAGGFAPATLDGGASLALGEDAGLGVPIAVSPGPGPGTPKATPALRYEVGCGCQSNAADMTLSGFFLLVLVLIRKRPVPG